MLSAHRDIHVSDRGITEEVDAFRDAHFIFYLENCKPLDNFMWVGEMLIDVFMDTEAPPNAHLLAKTMRQILACGIVRHSNTVSLSRMDIPVSIGVTAEVSESLRERLSRTTEILHSRASSWRFPVWNKPSGSRGGALPDVLDCAFVLHAVDIVREWPSRKPTPVPALVAEKMVTCGKRTSTRSEEDYAD